MTTKSDFAQKLLTDLRLRKQRMAAAAHHSSGSNSTRGSNSNPGPGTAYKGSRQTKTYESVGFRSGNSSVKPTSSTNTSNQQLVPYVNGTSSEDLSKAIALAFPNGVKLQKMDAAAAAGSIPVLSFLQEIGKRSLGSGSIEIRSSFGTNSPDSHIITFSQVHISQISKGIQKLNQILKDSSNGMNLDKYSTNVGKELLKGAIDLEKSLRMLANFNEGSDYMINPRGKNKIKLLKDNDKDDGSEDAKPNDLKQVQRPRFSFDKTNKNSRHTKQAANDIIKQQTPLALTYPVETQRSAIHSRSASCIPENERISSHRQPQKPRTSNVIAKLMGLEELPPKEDLKTMASKGDINSSDLKPEHTKSKPPFTKSKDASTSLRTNADSVFTLKAEKNTSTVPATATIDDKQQEVIKDIQIDEDLGSQETGKEYNDEEKEKKIKKTSKIDYTLLQEETQRTAPVEHGGSEAEHVSERSEIKDNVKTGEQTADSLPLSKQEKQKVRKLDGVEEKRNLQHPKQKLLTRKPKESQQARLDKSKPKSSPRVLEKKQACKLENGKKIPVKQLEANVLPKSTFNKRHGLDSAKSETFNHVHASIQQAKADERKISKRQIHRKVDAAVNGRNLVSKPMEQQNDNKTSISGLAKQGSNPEIPETVSSQSSKPEASSQTSNLAELPKKVAEDVFYHNPSMEKDQSPVYYMDPTENKNSINNSEEAPEVTHDSQPSQQPLVCADDLSKEPTKSSPLHRGDDEVKAVAPHIDKHTRNGPTWSADQLTESEKHLNEILIKGQLFLHTAEALFKLNIPVSMLHGADYNDQVADTDTKLILDCGNELLMRKGRRQELACYSFKAMSFDCAMFKTFDVLIKQLNKDICHLKSYGGQWEEEYDPAEYIYHMLEKDVHNKDPDVQCMWDFGWYEKTFAYSEEDELIKDVEKHMLRGLLDELTRDLLHTESTL